MQISVVREQYRPGCTVGRMFVDGTFECFTLEDGIRTKKVYGETAIPAGSYSVIVNYSPRFKTSLPLLQDVPNFEGVRIHPGNTAANTLGCILVGRNWTPGSEQVTASRLAFEPLKQKIVDAIARGEEVHWLSLRKQRRRSSRAARCRSVRRSAASPRQSRSALRARRRRDEKKAKSKAASPRKRSKLQR